MNILLSLIDYVIIYKFFEKIFLPKNWYYKRFCVFAYSIFCIFIMASSVETPLIYNFICFSSIIFFSLFQKGKRNTIIAYVLIFLASRVLCRFLAITVCRQLVSYNASYIIFEMKQIQRERAITNLLNYTSVVILCRKSNKEYKELPVEITGFVIGTLMMTLIGVYVIYYFLFKVSEINPDIVFCFILLILFEVHYLTIVGTEKANKSLMEIYNQKMSMQEREFEKEYFYELQEKVKELRKIRHDYKNQLLALIAVKKLDESSLNDEIKLLLQEMEKTENIIYTENYVLNAICKSKFAIAEDLKINVTWNLPLPSRISMPSNELGCLFGNLLDNAIEACEKLEHDRKIDLQAYIKEEKMMIRIKNTCISDSFDENNFVTEKEDKENHGFGLESIRKIVKKYHGTMKIINENHEFVVQLMMYGIKEMS